MADNRNNVRIRIFEGETAASCEEQANAWLSAAETGDITVVGTTVSASSKVMLTTYNYRGFQDQNDEAESPGQIVEKIVLVITYAMVRR